MCFESHNKQNKFKIIEKKLIGYWTTIDKLRRNKFLKGGDMNISKRM